MADFKVMGRTFEVDEGVLEDIQKELEITRFEAVKSYFEDIGVIAPGSKEEIVETLPTKSKRKYNKSGKERKPSTRERKVDPNKLALMSILTKALTDSAIEYEPTVNETDIHFTYCGESFSIKLTKHRAKK